MYDKNEYWHDFNKEEKFKEKILVILNNEYQPRRKFSFKFYYKTVRYKLINDSIAQQIVDHCIDNFNNMPTPSQFHDAVDAVFPRESKPDDNYDINNRETENLKCSYCGKSWKEVEKYDEYTCIHCNLRKKPDLGKIQKTRAEIIFNNKNSTKQEIRWAKIVTGQEIIKEDYSSEDWHIKNQLENLIEKITNKDKIDPEYRNNEVNF